MSENDEKWPLFQDNEKQRILWNHMEKKQYINLSFQL